MTKSHLREIVNELKLQIITLIKSLFFYVDTLVTDFIDMYCVYSFPFIQNLSRYNNRYYYFIEEKAQNKLLK